MGSVSIDNSKGWSVVTLEDEAVGVIAEIIPSAGGMLNGLYLNTGKGILNVIDGYSGPDDFKKRVHEGFRSAKLSPFVCRLNQSLYSWKGKTYKLDQKFVLNGSALHGILYDAPFDVVEKDSNEKLSSVTLRYQYDGQLDGYPFPYNCTIRYCLDDSGKLTIQTHLSNPAAAEQSIPLADGWHPYFQLGGKIDEAWLEIASDSMFEYDDQLIPTGRYLFNSDFYPGRILGDLKLDNGFKLKDNVSPLCTLKSDQVCLEFISVKNYPFLQLYIPDHRNSIAIENLSAAPDAFNNGIGLTILEPGQKADFEVCLKISSLAH
jgi:aldose 1-epimerase